MKLVKFAAFAQEGESTQYVHVNPEQVAALVGTQSHFTGIMLTTGNVLSVRGSQDVTAAMLRPDDRPTRVLRELTEQEYRDRYQPEPGDPFAP